MSPVALLQEFSGLHLLRPWWLSALLFLPLLAWWWRRRERVDSAWLGFVDPHLLPTLLETRGGRGMRVAPWLAAVAYLLAVLALAGPSWRRAEQPLWQNTTPLVVALDLSTASLAADLPPSRLAQARAKLAMLLRQREGGQIGLVAFAGDAFTVAPLTEDAANVALFLDALQPDIMPRDGQRADQAIAWSARLLERAGINGGDIVLLTNRVDQAGQRAAADTAKAGYRVSVIGLGTEAGAAYRRSDGAIVGTRLDAASLRALASSGNGRYAALAGDDADLRALGLLDPGRTDSAAGEGTGASTWRDEGYWLLPPLMLLALFAFRRRSGGALLLVLLCAGMPLRSAHAQDPWRRADQAEHARIERGNAAYRRGDYPSAAQAYAGADTATAHYNRGNALAKAGRYQDAIAAYDEALRRQPRMADALANKRAVEAAMKRQPSSPSGDSQQRQSEGGQSGQAQPSPGDGSKPRQPSQQGDAQRDAPPDTQRKAEQQSEPRQTEPQDARSQQEADRAQRERIERALQQAQPRDGKESEEEARRREETPEERERRLANEAWLKRVPDDPGGLLRAKFRLEYERRVSQGRTEQ